MVIGQDVFISGDNVAKSPALFAYLQAKKLHPKESIRVVSVGSVIEEPYDLFNYEYSLLKWADYLLRQNHQIV